MSREKHLKRLVSCKRPPWPGDAAILDKHPYTSSGYPKLYKMWPKLQDMPRDMFLWSHEKQFRRKEFFACGELCSIEGCTVVETTKCACGWYVCSQHAELDYVEMPPPFKCSLCFDPCAPKQNCRSLKRTYGLRFQEVAAIVSDARVQELQEHLVPKDPRGITLPKRCDSLCAACCEDGAACKTWMGKCDLCLRTTCINHAEINVEGIFGDKRCADGTVPDVICRACAAAVEVATGTEKTGNNVAGLGITLDKSALVHRCVKTPVNCLVAGSFNGLQLSAGHGLIDTGAQDFVIPPLVGSIAQSVGASTSTTSPTSSFPSSSESTVNISSTQFYATLTQVPGSSCLFMAALGICQYI